MHQDRHRRDGAAAAERGEADAQHLRNRRDQIDAIERDQRQHRAVPRMNITAMIGAASDHRTRDRAHRVAALAGVNRHVLEPAERAEPHLAEQVQTHQRDDRRRRRQRVKGGERAVVHDSATAATISAAKIASHHRAAGLVHPLADPEPENGDDHERADRDRAHERDEQCASPRATRCRHRARRRDTASTCSPVSDVFRMANSHRFHATRNPASSLKPSFAH